MKRMIWKCEWCGDVVISYSYLRHDMNVCDCQESAVDFEEGYVRIIGDVEVLSIKERKNGRWEKIK